MIQITNLSKSYGTRKLLENITFSLGARERVGLVGRNGSGKSTLLKIIQGDERVNSGEVVIPKNYKLGILEQHISFSQKTLLEECTQILKNEEAFHFYKAEKILIGLGFSTNDFQRPPCDFSSGYQLRINLCKALLKEPNLLLLDEPTNYLDILSLRWLKRFLQAFPGEIITITHDRDFMDSITTHTMGICRKSLKKFKGGTEIYYAKIKEEEDIYEKTRANQEKKKKEMMENIEKFRAKARRAGQAQSKLKMLNRMKSFEHLEKEDILDFSFCYRECPGKVLLEVENLSFGFGKKHLFETLQFFVGKKDKIGIIGQNGAGKSTLLNVLSGALKAKTGSIKCHSKAHVAHFGQTNIQKLHPHNTIIQEIQASNEDLTTTKIRSIAGTMMFPGDDGEKKIQVLSGGERARVMLGKILSTPSNVLLLDEPTNHLDMESVEVLKHGILHFPGACLLVTHSEYLLKEICNRLIIFREGGAESFHGNYDDFLRKIGWEMPHRDSQRHTVKKLLKKDYKKRRSEIIKKRGQHCTPLKREIESCEKQIFSLEELLKEKNNLLFKKEENSARKGISQEIGDTHIKIEQYFQKLEALTERHDALLCGFENELNELESSS